MRKVITPAKKKASALFYRLVNDNWLIRGTLIQTPDAPKRCLSCYQLPTTNKVVDVILLNDSHDTSDILTSVSTPIPTRYISPVIKIDFLKLLGGGRIPDEFLLGKIYYPEKRENSSSPEGYDTVQGRCLEGFATFTSKYEVVETRKRMPKYAMRRICPDCKTLICYEQHGKGENYICPAPPDPNKFYISNAGVLVPAKNIEKLGSFNWKKNHIWCIPTDVLDEPLDGFPIDLRDGAPVSDKWCNESYAPQSLHIN